ncbi:MAG: C39 family peptidase [Phycisphaerae bacterium]|nr:C39 family peptidase [Phycisphaerae bacterium]
MSNSDAAANGGANDGEETCHLPLDILPQPDDVTCGPTCLHAVYDYFGESLPLKNVIAEVTGLEEGGTLAVFLAVHALRRGYSASIYTYNLQLFDPTWFAQPGTDIAAKLKAQSEAKSDKRLQVATGGYLEYLKLGGKILFEDLTAALIRKYLTRGVPILTGLSSTYLYRGIREFGPKCDDDDIRGAPVGHFVVLCGYDRKHRQVMVADPMHPNPMATTHVYSVGMDRLLGAILLGIVTYDANLLILERGPSAGTNGGAVSPAPGSADD